MQGGMKIKHLVFSLLPALAVAENATTVPDDEPWHPPLPEELLSPQKGQEALPATARPVVSYRAPKDEEQTWLKLFFVKDTEEWPGIFRRMAAASHEKDMQMCHGYALWLKGQPLIHLRYDDDLSLSGIHADGHAYGVLYVEFSPYGIRVCPMEGYDLSGKNGGVCWQDAATRLWSWAEADKFWAELPKLLKADAKTRATSAQDTAVKREVATKGQRMVVFWAPPGYPAKTWWPSFARLHAEVGANRFSLIASDGLKLWTDVAVPNLRATTPASSAPATPAPVAGAAPAATPAPAPAPAAPPSATKAPAALPPVAPAPSTTPAPAPGAAPAPSSPATAVQPVAPAAGPSAGAPAAAPVAEPHLVPATLQPAAEAPQNVTPPASARPWAQEGAGEAAAAGGRKPASAAPAPAPSAGTPSPAAPAPAAKPGKTSAAAPSPTAAPSTPRQTTPAPAAQAATAPVPSAKAPAPAARGERAPASAPAESTPAPGNRNLDAVNRVILP